MHTDHAMFDRMRLAGVRLAEFHPVKPWECKYSWRPWNRDHRKLLVVDDDQAWLGGLNIGGEYAGSWIVGSPQEDSPWRDNAISLRGPSARLLVHPLVKTWRYIQNGGHIGQTEYLHNVHQGEFGVVASTPTRRSPLQMLRILLAKAH